MSFGVTTGLGFDVLGAPRSFPMFFAWTSLIFLCFSREKKLVFWAIIDNVATTILSQVREDESMFVMINYKQ